VVGITEGSFTHDIITNIKSWKDASHVRVSPSPSETHGQACIGTDEKAKNLGTQLTSSDL